jgi:adenylate cyclase
MSYFSSIDSLGACSQAALDAGGQPNQFVGDGVLALSELNRTQNSVPPGCARPPTSTNVDYMNRQLASDLPEPIQYGIGIQGGEVIIGDIGFQDTPVFTRLATVNVAARLQDMTKALDCRAVISDEVFATACISAHSLSRTEVAIRGREEPMIVRTVADPTVLVKLVEAENTQIPQLRVS